MKEMGHIDQTNYLKLKRICMLMPSHISNAVSDGNTQVHFTSALSRIKYLYYFPQSFAVAD
jgi:hypothetical protein